MSEIWSVSTSPLYLAVATAFALVGLYSVFLTATRNWMVRYVKTGKLS